MLTIDVSSFCFSFFVLFFLSRQRCGVVARESVSKRKLADHQRGENENVERRHGTGVGGVGGATDVGTRRKYGELSSLFSVSVLWPMVLFCFWYMETYFELFSLFWGTCFQKCW